MCVVGGKGESVCRGVPGEFLKERSRGEIVAVFVQMSCFYGLRPVVASATAKRQEKRNSYGRLKSTRS